jgi:hypothetical protein
MYPNTQTLETFKTASPLIPSSTMTESLFSASFPVTTTNQFLIKAVWTGTPTGNIVVSGSQDGVNFDIILHTIATEGVANYLAYDTFGTSVMYVRIDYEFSSGTGTLVCSASSKV